MVIIGIIITIINVIGMCVIMHILGKQNMYDDLLEHYEETLRLIGNQDALIQARLWHNASEKPNIGSEVLIQGTGEDDNIIYKKRILANFDWEAYIKENQIRKWCYTSDLS